MSMWKLGCSSTFDHRPARNLPGPAALILVPILSLAPTQAGAQANPDFQFNQLNCDAYARSYADAHTSADPTDVPLVDGAMEGAVAGGAWEGPDGARRGARVGAALSVLDTLGNYPAGWRGLYDLAYRLCRNQQSTIVHRPSTLGEPSYRPLPVAPGRAEPRRPTRPLEPTKPEN
ncbi:hypothetical protein [Roseibium sp. M-1]